MEATAKTSATKPMLEYCPTNNACCRNKTARNVVLVSEPSAAYRCKLAYGKQSAIRRPRCSRSLPSLREMGGKGSGGGGPAKGVVATTHPSPIFPLFPSFHNPPLIHLYRHRIIATWLAVRAAGDGATRRPIAHHGLNSFCPPLPRSPLHYPSRPSELRMGQWPHLLENSRRIRATKGKKRERPKRKTACESNAHTPELLKRKDTTFVLHTNHSPPFRLNSRPPIFKPGPLGELKPTSHGSKC